MTLLLIKNKKNWTTETLTAKILVVKTHLAIFFIANNEWKLWNNIFVSFSPQLSWRKEDLFIAPNMAPSWELLYNSLSIININFKGLCEIFSILFLLKNFIFGCVLFLIHFSYRNLKSRKKFLTSNLFATISWNIHSQLPSYRLLIFRYKIRSQNLR